MKKILVIIASIMLFGILKAQDGLTSQYGYSHESFDFGDKKGFIYTKKMLPENIAQIVVTGNAKLLWATDTINKIESMYMYSYADSNNVVPITCEGDTVRLNNKVKTIYLVHLKSGQDRCTIDCVGNGASEYLLDDPLELNELRDLIINLAESCSIMQSPIVMQVFMKTLFASSKDGMKAVSAALNSATNEREHLTVNTTSNSNTSANRQKKKDKKFFNDFDFHWGFNNWGSTPINGLIGMSDPGYDLRTSFSSYQLSYSSNVKVTKHFILGIGLGYESDVYKFNNSYVVFNDNTFATIDTTNPFGYYSTRFVTRYVQLPIHIGWSSNRKRSAFNVCLSAIPALGWCGKHTGLKHELHVAGKNTQDQYNLKEALNPYKLDVRLDIDFGGIGVFLQVATLPQFVEGAKIYPIKLGFKI